jgi:hypothetical protein
MGAKSSRIYAGGISDKDFDYLHAVTGLQKTEIKQIYEQFIENNSDGLLSIHLY